MITPIATSLPEANVLLLIPVMVGTDVMQTTLLELVKHREPPVIGVFAISLTVVEAATSVVVTVAAVKTTVSENL